MSSWNHIGFAIFCRTSEFLESVFYSHCLQDFTDRPSPVQPAICLFLLNVNLQLPPISHGDSSSLHCSAGAPLTVMKPDVHLTYFQSVFLILNKKFFEEVNSHTHTHTHTHIYIYICICHGPHRKRRVQGLLYLFPELFNKT
jgi:hypothetical protein